MDRSVNEFVTRWRANGAADFAEHRDRLACKHRAGRPISGARFSGMDEELVSRR
jgi:hypothetical protein